MSFNCRLTNLGSRELSEKCVVNMDGWDKTHCKFPSLEMFRVNVVTHHSRMMLDVRWPVRGRCSYLKSLGQVVHQLSSCSSSPTEQTVQSITVGEAAGALAQVMLVDWWSPYSPLSHICRRKKNKN